MMMMNRQISDARKYRYVGLRRRRSYMTTRVHAVYIRYTGEVASVRMCLCSPEIELILPIRITHQTPTKRLQ